MARSVGVAEPERVRVEIVERLPLPEDAALHAAALQAGLLGPNMTGLTLGHSTFICRGHKTRRLLSHELRHVYQYAQAGSIAAFLPMYLRQVAEMGYAAAPLEVDARAHEVQGLGKLNGGSMETPVRWIEASPPRRRPGGISNSEICFLSSAC